MDHFIGRIEKRGSFGYLGDTLADAFLRNQRAHFPS